MTPSNHASLLLALQHGDSQFPSGSFAFSQGLEAASQLATALGPFDFQGFATAQLRHRWAISDRPALARAHRLRPLRKRKASHGERPRQSYGA